MKANISSIDGKEKGPINLPKIFEGQIREDIVLKVLESMKRKHPYSPSPVAGKQQSAKGKIRHRRHVWQTHYGRGMSRIPRKVMWSRGTQFSWEGAEVPQAKGGMRAHPPKVISMMNNPKINKKEIKRALISAFSATVKPEIVAKRYSSLNEKPKSPFVVDSKITELKAKELISSVKKVLGEKVFGIAIKKKSTRAGRGKMRGRKYKKNYGMLLVIGKDERLKSNSFDIRKTNELSIEDLAKGGLGRLTMYTEKAIKDLGELK